MKIAVANTGKDTAVPMNMLRQTAKKRVGAEKT